MAVKIDELVSQFDELKNEKAPLLPLLQLVGDYTDPVKSEFTYTDKTQGDSYNDHIFDSTAIKAKNVAASALISLLWPNGGQSVEVEADDDTLKSDAETQEWFAKVVNPTLRKHFDDPRAGMDAALIEYMQEQLDLGTSGISLEEGRKSLFSFSALSNCYIYIDEDEEGFVDTIFIDWAKMTIRKAVKKYGLQKLSKKTQDLYNSGKGGEKIRIIQAIYPRSDRDPKKKGNDNLPWASCHWEFDTKHLVKESGYHEYPAPVGRWRKRTGWKYGIGAGMDALPDNLELQDVRESRNMAREKTLDPALLVMDDGKMGGGVIDTSAGAINVVRVSGRAGNQPPIQPLYQVGDIRVADQEILDLQQSIMSHYLVDRLLDLNNDVEMTLGEAQMRDAKSAKAMRSFLGRQISEVFTPIVERGFNMLLRAGKFGVVKGSDEERAAIAMGQEPKYIPAAILKFAGTNERVYRVNYLTPAARIMQTEEATAVMEIWNMALMIKKTDPASDCVDILDADESLRVIHRVRGGPNEIIRSNEAITAIRAARAEQAKQEAQMQQAAQMAAVGKQAGEAQQALAAA